MRMVIQKEIHVYFKYEYIWGEGERDQDDNYQKESGRLVGVS